MKKSRLTRLLNELYDFDPSLKEHEQELMVLLTKLVEAKPAIAIDKQFVARLKSQLMQEEPQASLIPSWAFGLGGGLIAIVLLVVSIFSITNPGSPFLSDPSSQFLARSVTPVGKNAFGNLIAATSLTSQEAAEGLSSYANPEPTFGMGGGGLIADDKRTAMMLPPQEWVQYNYVYTGGALPLDEEEGPVYRRVKSRQGSAQLAQQVQQLGINVIDLSAFSQLQAESINLSENRRNGLSISIDFVEEAFYLNPNWRQWEDEPASQPLRMNDLPSDEAVKNIANRFLTRYGIDTSSFAEPMVNRDFERWMLFADPGTEGYVPEELQVIYPLRFEEALVSESYGTVYGLTVNVNVRKNQVVSVNNLFTQNFESSLYDLETDSATILNLAGLGGMNRNYFDESANYRTVELELDRVDRVYVHHWQYDGTESQELFVPALRFHVKEGQVNEQPLPPEFIVVPLATDLLDELENQPRPIPVEPFSLPASEEPVAVPEDLMAR